MDHLDENEIARFVDALRMDTQDQLPEEIREHVAECFHCKMELIAMWEIVEFLENPTYVRPVSIK